MQEDVKKYLGYLIANGQEPLRGTKDAKIRARGKIRSNVLLTGETDFISLLANDGAHVRAIVFTNRPIPKQDNPQVIWNAKDGMCTNYGHILPMFLREFALHQDEVLSWYRKACDRLQNTTNDEKQKRKAAYFAAAEVAGILLENIYSSLNLGKFNAQHVVSEIWEECVLGTRDIPLAIRALNTAYEFCVTNANRHFLEGDSKATQNKQDIYGWFGDGYIDITQGNLDDFLQKKGYTGTSAIYRYWREHNIIDTNGPKAFVKTTHHYQSSLDQRVTVGVIRIRIDKLYEAISLDADVTSQAGKIKTWSDLRDSCAISVAPEGEEDDDWPINPYDVPDLTGLP